MTFNDRTTTLVLTHFHQKKSCGTNQTYLNQAFKQKIMSSQFLIQILLFAVFFSLNKSISNNVIVHFRLDDYNQIEILIDTSSENAQVYIYHSSCMFPSIQNPKFDGLIALS